MIKLRLIVLAFRTLLFGCALVFSSWAKLPWFTTAGLGLLGFSCLAGEFQSDEKSRRNPGRLVLIAWAGAVAVVIGWAHALSRGVGWDSYFAFFFWLLAVVLTRGEWVNHPVHRPYWRMLVLTLVVLGASILVAASYLHNESVAFHIGLLITLGTCVLCLSWFRLPAIGGVLVSMLMLSLAGLPLVDLGYRLYSRMDLRPEPGRRYYLYAEAKKSPVAYGRWWKYYLQELDRMQGQLEEKDPTGLVPYRLRANSACMVGDCRISINSRGMRGREISTEKGAAYRIVAIGESTTFGMTLFRNERPWPELLEQMINERLHLRQPVEVVNAGVPAYTILNNLDRLQRDIQPLHPDMIISYHGFNGFGLVGEALPRTATRRPPTYQPRPLKLLADCEYKLQMVAYKRQSPRPRTGTPPWTLSDPLTTDYAAAYRRLIEFGTTNHIRIVLANYSMSVNSNSSVDVIQFYQETFTAKSLFDCIQANDIHSTIVQRLSGQYPGVFFVDTHSNLDGNPDKFIDLMHFAPEGEEQMAENIFTGIQPLLRNDPP